MIFIYQRIRRGCAYIKISKYIDLCAKKIKAQRENMQLDVSQWQESSMSKAEIAHKK